MATTSLDAEYGWNVSNKYTAGSAVEVLLGNATVNASIAFEITASDVLPTLSVNEAMKLAPGLRQILSLASGDRLWVSTIQSGVTGVAAILVMP
jgi:hypothetical protein